MSHLVGTDQAPGWITPGAMYIMSSTDRRQTKASGPTSTTAPIAGNGTGPWRRSTRCYGGPECVEARVSADSVEVRDSKDISGPRLLFNATSWTLFVDEMKEGSFETTSLPGPLS
jgi:hypothetical protein